jgi:hypothetical protein
MNRDVDNQSLPAPCRLMVKTVDGSQKDKRFGPGETGSYLPLGPCVQLAATLEFTRVNPNVPESAGSDAWEARFMQR